MLAKRLPYDDPMSYICMLRWSAIIGKPVIRLLLYLGL